MTDRDEVLAAIRERVAAMASVDPGAVTAASRLIDFGIDSARAMELLADLEEAYGISIEEDEIEDLVTLGDLAAFVAGRAGGG